MVFQPYVYVCVQLFVMAFFHMNCMCSVKNICMNGKYGLVNG